MEALIVVRRFKRERFFVLCMIGVLGFSGCALFKHGASGGEEARIMRTLTAWKLAFTAQDIPKLLETYSSSYENGPIKGKAQLKAFFEEKADLGYMDEAVIALDVALMNIQKDQVRVFPIVVKTSRMSSTMALYLVKERGRWLIKGVDEKN